MNRFEKWLLKRLLTKMRRVYVGRGVHGADDDILQVLDLVTGWCRKEYKL